MLELENNNLNMHCTGLENNVKQMVPHRQFPNKHFTSRKLTSHYVDNQFYANYNEYFELF